jgi:hypothetical protein
MNTFDIRIQLHHFYRKESSTLELSYKKKLSVCAEQLKKRLRWISYFHVIHTVEARIQTTMEEQELLQEMGVLFSPTLAPEILKYSIKKVQ